MALVNDSGVFIRIFDIDVPRLPKKSDFLFPDLNHQSRTFHNTVMMPISVRHNCLELEYLVLMLSLYTHYSVFCILDDEDIDHPFDCVSGLVLNTVRDYDTGDEYLLNLRCSLGTFELLFLDEYGRSRKVYVDKEFLATFSMNICKLVESRCIEFYNSENMDPKYDYVLLLDDLLSGGKDYDAESESDGDLEKEYDDFSDDYSDDYSEDYSDDYSEDYSGDYSGDYSEDYSDGYSSDYSDNCFEDDIGDDFGDDFEDDLEDDFENDGYQNLEEVIDEDGFLILEKMFEKDEVLQDVDLSKYKIRPDDDFVFGFDENGRFYINIFIDYNVRAIPLYQHVLGL